MRGALAPAPGAGTWTGTDPRPTRWQASSPAARERTGCPLCARLWLVVGLSDRAVGVEMRPAFASCLDQYLSGWDSSFQVKKCDSTRGVDEGVEVKYDET